MTNHSQRIYGIKYYGQYKPLGPYELEEGLYIVPGDWEMVSYGVAQARQNISYLVTTRLESEESFKGKYRDWLIFDSLVLYDTFPIYFYDENVTGNAIEEFEPSFIETIGQIEEYKSKNYDDIDQIVLLTREKQMELSYRDLFRTYISLDKKDKELIEWFVAKPSRSHTRLNPIFNVSYWQLFHLTVLLDTLIGIPPRCNHKYEQCPECKFEPYPHYSVSRNRWLDEYLTALIKDEDVKNQYSEVINQAFQVRNKFAHFPVIDRSEHPEIPIGFTDIYAHDRAIDEHRENSIALQALLVNLNDICRYLLLNKLFSLGFFKKLKPLLATRVGNSGAA